MDRRNADAIFADALALARQASDYDKSGQAEAAIVHYRNAIGLFQEASAMDKNLRTDVNKQAYCKLAQNRLDHLLAVQNPPGTMSIIIISVIGLMLFIPQHFITGFVSLELLSL